MPLANLTLTPGHENVYRSGSGFTSFQKLLQELREGVLELGVGQCEVRSNDNPMERKFGFELSAIRGGNLSSWVFDISLTKFKSDPECRLWHPQMATTTGRVQIAQWFQEGWTIEEMVPHLATTVSP